MTRLAIVDKDSCKPDDCALECIKFCPVNRTGKECIVLPKDSKTARISEVLCNGCGICVKKCPFDAIKIINLPHELENQITHRYGQNQFKLHRLPVPKKGGVIGLVGQNGAGKSTSLNILSGQIKPNLGYYDRDVEWDEIIKHYKGNELQSYFKVIADGNFRASIKPQNVERLPSVVKGEVGELINRVDELGLAQEVKQQFSLTNVWDRKLSQLSGGELQRLAIAATIVKDADAYFFDEPTSFLDVRERMKISKYIQNLVNEKKTIVVVEHDLAILDYLSDFIHLYYGVAGAYGVVTYPLSVREGINIFLDGYIPVENMRFRPNPITFHRSVLSDFQGKRRDPLVSYPSMTKDYDTFKMENMAGQMYPGDIVGILGPNGIGKTTFAQMIAGRLEPTSKDGEVELVRRRPRETSDKDKEEEDENLPLILEISYKPQYLDNYYNSGLTIEQMLMQVNPAIIASSFFKTELLKPLGLESLLKRDITTLSGGELQRAAIAHCLAKDADLYLIDEPSAFISAEDRVNIAKSIRRMINYRKSAGIIIEHDLLLQAYISDRIIHFDGEPGQFGKASPPLTVQEGMNDFLKTQEITFRGDPQTGRPRVNKLDSKLDKMQKGSGNYYQMI
jgi:ATP-binding cassette, sub-family E, member 1